MQIAVIIPDHSRDSSVSRKVLFKAEDYQIIPEEFMTQEHLDGLTSISIENNEISQTIKDEVINHFACVNTVRKSRFS